MTIILRTVFLIVLSVVLDGCERKSSPAVASIKSCIKLVEGRFLAIPEDRADRFLGKVEEDTARCRGGEKAVQFRDTPWVDWSNYWATGDASSRETRYDDGALRKVLGSAFEKIHVDPNMRGIDGALIDLEYARVELIKFNLFDNYTFEHYMPGAHGVDGPALKKWDEMRLPPHHPRYQAVGGDDMQRCSGELIRHRTVSGICNDIVNPLMGSTGTVFARNVQFEEVYPDEGTTDLTRARHAGRISLMEPDPQLVSRKLFTRAQSAPDRCNRGQGLPDASPDGHCDYKAAPFFNVLAAFWIQFMTHDWFSHLVEGDNDTAQPLHSGGCSSDQARAAGCRSNDQYQVSLVARQDDPGTFSHDGERYRKRAPKTFANNVTAWWDASQIYGYDEVSRGRVKRDPNDRAKLLLRPLGDDDAHGYLTRFAESCRSSGNTPGCENINPIWSNQETAAFPDNWTIGMSFYHNVFSREHNVFVDAFRAETRRNPAGDSGLRNPATPDRVIAYAEVTDDELFEAARLVVAAEIAKIHTIEWTTQLLYDEPLFRGMNGNWHGLFGNHELLARALDRIIVNNFGAADDVKKHNQWYSVFAAGPGIVGLGSKRYADKSVFERIVSGQPDIWSISNPEHVNGGVNHFGSPFNFPEEFITVYRLHPLVPDLLELRHADSPDVVVRKIPAATGFRAGASDLMESYGLADWALTMGRQRLGLLALQNHAQFLQNLPAPRLKTASNSGLLDVAALDLIRDRERGIPRFNEFRRQYGLRQLTSFDDFIDRHLEKDSAAYADQVELVATLREVYGQHVCDASKVISHAQRDAEGNYPNDCLGHPDGTPVDNVEDLDTVVGWLAETTRPHGFAISETQFVVFILNASRRLFSDRFFTSSFRPEFYTALGHEWVVNNGPDGVIMEKGAPNGTEQPVSPMKRILQRTIPELREELAHVVNVFDPWARDRGDYYSLQWKAQPRAQNDSSFAD